MLTTIYGYVDSKRIKSEHNAVHIRDLNFVLQSEIFVHFDGHLRATHLILGCTPIYTNFQDPSQVLTISSPLLSYLDVQLCSFLPPGLTPGKARRLSPWQIRVGLLLTVRDYLANIVFQGCTKHIPVSELEEEA